VWLFARATYFVVCLACALRIIEIADAAEIINNYDWKSKGWGGGAAAADQ